MINTLEWFGAISGIVSVWLTIRQSIFTWYIGGLSVSMYIVLFYQQRLYSDTLLHVFYLISSFYGWYQWTFNKEINSSIGGVRNATLSEYWKGVCLSAIISLFLIYIFKQTNADRLYIDAILAAGSIWGTYWMAKKIIEHWILWLFIDSAYIYLYLDKALYVTAVLYFIFVIMVIKGYYDWRKELHA